MRIVVYGAGAIGGVVAARLAEHGHDVMAITRGEHGVAIAARGLRIESPAGSAVVQLPVAAAPDGVEWREDDVVLLGMKLQDSEAAVRELAAAAPASTPVVCLQNGVEGERIALRRFTDVYAVCVMCPATHLEPGIVQASSSPMTGLLDIGRYPSSADDTASALAAAFESSTFESIVRPDIMRWKYQKLLMNLGNAVEAVCARGDERKELRTLARAEGIACLEAAGIDFASDEEDAARRGHRLQMAPIDGRPRGGGSSWQSLARATGSIETDYLTGEIVLLGRLQGVPTPVNELLQREAARLARTGAPPGSVPPESLLAILRQ